MTIALTATLILHTLGFLLVLDRKDARASAERARTLDQIIEERVQHRRELQVLIQRIHAPEVAAVRHDAEQAQAEPAGAPPLLDEEFWREHQQAAEYIAQQEALENAPFDRA